MVNDIPRHPGKLPLPVGKCSECGVNISREDIDLHTPCISYWGANGNLKDGCDISKDWSEDRMKELNEYYAALAPEKAHKVKKRRH